MKFRKEKILITEKEFTFKTNPCSTIGALKMFLYEIEMAYPNLYEKYNVAIRAVANTIEISLNRLETDEEYAEAKKKHEEFELEKTKHLEDFLKDYINDYISKEIEKNIEYYQYPRFKNDKYPRFKNDKYSRFKNDNYKI